MIIVQLATQSTYTLPAHARTERMICSLLNEDRAMLWKADLNKGVWSKTLLQKDYVHKRTVTRVLSMKPLKNICWKMHPNNPLIMNFSNAAYGHKQATQITDKLDDREIPGVYVGSRHGMYRKCIPISQTILIAKHVVFNETGFSLAKAIQTEYVSIEQESEMDNISVCMKKVRMYRSLHQTGTERLKTTSKKSFARICRATKGREIYEKFCWRDSTSGYSSRIEWRPFG